MSITELLHSIGIHEESPDCCNFYRSLTLKTWPDNLVSEYLSLEHLKRSYAPYAALKITPEEYLDILESILHKYPDWKSFIQSAHNQSILSKGYGPGIAYAYHNRR